MCGIAGILSTSSNNRPIVEAMNAMLIHRGPDGHGYYEGENIALAHRRLSIIDLSDFASQPMYSADGNLVIVYNGELYNFKELKERLKSYYNFKTQSDTEVILAAFKTWGPDCLKEFNGIFAFAIWNTETKKLFLARDPLGVKPLYYYRSADCLLFASGIRSIMASGKTGRKISRQGVLDFLSYQSVHEPSSMIKGIYQLKAGFYAWADLSSFKQSQYYDITESNYVPGTSYNQVKSNISDLFYKAVDRQMISDVPLAVFLSGGIDSTAIVGAASKISTTPIHTFSIGFTENQYDESKYARLVAKRYGTEHQEFKVSSEIFLEHIEAALNAATTPTGDGPNTYLISNLVKSTGIKVALSGLGGDELFAGYSNFKTYYQLKKYQNKVPAWMRQSLGSIFMRSSHRSVQKLAELLHKPSFEIAHTYPTFRRIFTEAECQRLSPNLAMYDDSVLSGLLWDSESNNKLPVLSQYSVAELKNYTANVLLESSDLMSMANSIELRVPFLDIELLKYVIGIPDAYKYPSSPKKLLVESLSELIPDEIVNRPKMGFAFPWDVWMRNELKDFCEMRINRLAARGLFVPEEVISLWRSFLSPKSQTQWFKVWLLVVLDHWMEQNEIEV